MSAIYAGPVAPLVSGVCCWRWHWEDVDLGCSDHIVPGTGLCADHYIEHIQATPPRPLWSAA